MFRQTGRIQGFKISTITKRSILRILAWHTEHLLSGAVSTRSTGSYDVGRILRNNIVHIDSYHDAQDVMSGSATQYLFSFYNVC